MTLRSLPAVVWTALIFFFCLMPLSWFGPPGPAGEPSWLDRLLGPLPADKVIHAGLFAVFALLWRWAGASTRGTFLGGLVVAMASEFGQSIPGLDRSTDLADLIADLLGMGVSLAVLRPWGARSPEPAAAS